MATPVRAFFVCAFALTWGIGLAGLIASRFVPGLQAFSTTSSFYWAAGYAVSLTGIAMTAIYDGRPGLGRLVERLLPWRAGPQWYAIVIGGYGVITFVAWQAAQWFGAAPAAMPGTRALVVGAALALAKDVGPLGEEFGWRGFALPRLLARWTPFQGTLILGAVHAAWHLPLFFIPGMPQHELSFPIFAVGVIAIAVIDTWIYLRSGANLLLAILVHLMANYCGGLFGPHTLPYFFAAEGAAALAIVAFGGLRSAAL